LMLPCVLALKLTKLVADTWYFPAAQSFPQLYAVTRAQPSSHLLYYNTYYENDDHRANGPSFAALYLSSFFLASPRAS